MAANMLCAYYSRECDSAELFQDLNIAKDPDFCKHLNRYDVIMLNIQQFLRKAANLSELPQVIEKTVLAELRERHPDLVSADETSLPDALTVIHAKEQRADKGFVFILDEWDCIFREQKEDKAALNIFDEFSMTDPKWLAEYVGFTEEDDPGRQGRCVDFAGPFRISGF